MYIVRPWDWRSALPQEATDENAGSQNAAIALLCDAPPRVA